MVEISFDVDCRCEGGLPPPLNPEFRGVIAAKNVSVVEVEDYRAVQRSLLTPKQVAEMLQVSAGWVRDHASRKQPHLPAVKLGKLLRFRFDDVNEFIKTWCS